MTAVAALVGAAPQAQSTGTSLESVWSATVMIEVLGPRGRSTGSGFVVLDDSTVATAAHVLQDAWQVHVRLASGKLVTATGVRGLWRDADLALLAVPPTGVRPVPVGPSSALKPGQRLLALGCPFGREIGVTDGLLSAVTREQGQRLLQVSIPVSPGSSGGPVFEENGTVVAMVISGMRFEGGENVNFALPLDDLGGRASAGAGPRVRTFSDLAKDAPAAPALASLPDPGSPPAGDFVLHPVNQNLILDFAALDGAEIASRWTRKDGARFTSLVQVGLSRGPGGETLVERLRETTIMLSEPLGRETHRTLLAVGGPNRFSTAVQFEPAQEGVQGYSSVLEARGPEYVMRSSDGRQRAGQVPPGAYPPAAADVVLAAQLGRDSVATFLVLDPLEERLLPVEFTIDRRETREFPLVTGGGSCRHEAETASVMLPVWSGTLRIGLDTKPVVILADPPHFVLEREVICLRLPVASRLARR